eukprot:s245_g1.t2
MGSTDGRRRVRVRYEGAARRATAPAGAGTASVPVQDLKGFENKDPLDGIVGPLSAVEAASLRQRAEELLLEAKDAQAAAEWCSAGLQRMALQLEGGAEQHVLALRGREIWEGFAIQADEAGTSQVRFGRLLESPELRGLMKNSKNGRLQVDPPSEQMLPNERLCSVYAGQLGVEQMELHLSRARCWLALDSAQRAVLDCSCALAICRLLAPPPPARAPGFELTVPLLVLGIAMAFARQFTVGIVLCAGAFLWDYLASQRAKRNAANGQLAKVLALRGRCKLQQGLAGLAQNELRWALEELGPLDEGGERQPPLLGLAWQMARSILAAICQAPVATVSNPELPAAMADEQKLSISVKNTFLDFRPEQEEVPLRRCNSWSCAKRSSDLEETPGGSEGAVVGMEEMEVVEQEVVEQIEVVEEMKVVEQIEVVEQMKVVEQMEVVEEADHGSPQPAEQQVCSVRDCNPCVYFISQRGCDQMCGWCHLRHSPRVWDKSQKKRPLKSTRDKYKDKIRRALALEEPECQRELQRLVVEHSYFHKVIMKILDRVPLSGQQVVQWKMTR